MCIRDRDHRDEDGHRTVITISWYVDDMKASHMKKKVIDDFIQWITDTYRKIRKVKVIRGPHHDYLGMRFDYSVKGQVSIDMIQYVQAMVDEFPKEELEGAKVPSPWNDNLFRVDDKSPSLSKEDADEFHTFTAKGLFACKRARPDISPAIAYLTT